MKRKFINIGDLVRLQQTDIQSDYHGIVTNIRDLANQNGMKERELLVMWCDQYPSTFGKTPVNPVGYLVKSFRLYLRGCFFKIETLYLLCK